MKSLVSDLSITCADAEPSNDNFKYEECDYPVLPLEEDEVLIRSTHLAIDPALRCRLNEDSGVDYMKAFEIGDTVAGFGGIGVVIKSSNKTLQKGDMVVSQFGWPWKLYFKTKPDTGVNLIKVDKAQCGDRPSLLLSVLGLTSGLTSYIGVTEKGNIKPGENQTFVVSGAAGACGSLAGQVSINIDVLQIAKLKGCGKVIGICGTDEKCNFLTKELGFDGAINYKTEIVKNSLLELCPDGVDIYFDNVGGEISNTVIRQMNKQSHVILCGQIAVYNKDLPYPPPIPEDVQKIISERGIKRDRFLVLNYPEKFDAALQELAEWVSQGKIKVHETITEGLENAGNAFVSLMKGGNIGKQIVFIPEK
ncbi:hypothetical protein KUTeg_014139 [Tegillarca granosa]|uniref:15-oxoprostaglandin 13-reductase n=1 Tax=Tegillarca granosa TaxID=220873 RepID=A0ABQ9EZJ4_TEGGR|nr:hypothetical protein KUTeg_014139 [Tegillarca granosa]